jgi:hypothetical protein
MSIAICGLSVDFPSEEFVSVWRLVGSKKLFSHRASDLKREKVIFTLEVFPLDKEYSRYPKESQIWGISIARGFLSGFTIVLI